MINKFNEIADLAGVSKIAFDSNRQDDFEYLSNCCGATGNDETMMCADCKEGCAFVNEHGFTFEEMKLKVVDKHGNIMSEAEIEEARLLAKADGDLDMSGAGGPGEDR